MTSTTIFAAIAALIVGIFAGSNFPADVAAPESQMTEDTTDSAYVIAANDFVSLRPSIENLPEETLSTEEKDGLLLMREEEKLARDVYETLYRKWGVQIFSNIAQSEQTHTEAVRDLLAKYNISDPVTDDTIGVFVNQDLQSLYDELVAQGSTSELDALVVGATIEDLDIYDLMNLISETDNEDIILVYENLTRGSRNHLRAFTRQIESRGGTYTPQYISETAYTEIIGGEQETGNGQQSGGERGWGKGKNAH